MEIGTSDIPVELARLGLTKPARRVDVHGHLHALVEEHALRVLNMLVWRHRADWHMVMRSLPNGLLFLPLDNRIEVEIAALAAVIGPGQVAVMPEGLPQAARYPKGVRRRVDLLAIHLTVHDRLGGDYLRRFADPFPRLHDWPRWQHCLLEATRAFNGGTADGRALASATMRSFLAELVAKAARMHPPSAMDPRIARSIALAQEQRAQAPGVSDLARRVGLSSRRFRDLFATNTGFHPKAWLLRDRLAEAARLLRTTTLPVKAVAGMLGFGTDHHFHAAFRTAYSCTPTDWRTGAGRQSRTTD